MRIALALVLLTLTTVEAPAAWRGQWIWHPMPELTEVYARISVVLDAKPVRARCVVTADNNFTLYVNGKELGSHAEWSAPQEYDLSGELKQGVNVIALRGGDDGKDAAGLLLDGLVWLEDGRIVSIATGPETRISDTLVANWQAADFDDAAWVEPVVHGPAGIQPWGELHRPEWFRLRGRVIASGWQGSAMPGQVGAATMALILEGAVPERGRVNVVFQLGGEDVWTTSVKTAPPPQQWKGGEAFEIALEGLELPIWLPRCELTFAPRIADLDLEGAGRVWIGERKPAPPHVNAMISRAFLDDATRTLDLEARFTPAGPLAGPLRWYLAMFRGPELWFADSFDFDAELGSWAAGQTITVARDIALPPLPAGRYDVYVGVHTTPRSKTRHLSLDISNDSGWYERPYGYGTFVDKFETPHFWYINPYGTIMWDGEPFIPVGGMYLNHWNGGSAHAQNWEADVEWLTKLRKVGVTDIYFNPCRNALDHPAYTWQSLFETAEEAGVTYCWDFPMHVDDLRGFHIDMRDYIVPLGADGTASVFIPSGYFGRTDPRNRVLYAAFNPQRNALLATGFAEVREAREGVNAAVKFEHPEAQGAVIKFIPELTYRGDMHDYWTGVTDHYLWRITQMLQRLRPGPNFRGFIDPLDNEQSFRDQQRMLPASAAFRDQFALWLTKRYADVDELTEAWSLVPPAADFREAASLVPVGAATPEAKIGWATTVDGARHFRVDLERSQLWDDMMQFRDNSIRDYNNKLADVVKAVIDAPVLMKLTELDAFTNDQTVGGMDALGLEAYSPAPELVRGCGGGVYARSVQAARTMWMLVTETGFARTDLAPVGYPDPLRMIHELASMVEYGARGTYYFVFVPSQGGNWRIFNIMGEDPRQLAWMGAFSHIMKRSRDLPMHRPIVDFSFPQKQVGQIGFRRADPDYYGTPPHVSVITHGGRWVVPVSELPGIDPLVSDARLVVNLENRPASRRYAPTVEQALQKGWPLVQVGLRHDLGVLSLDEYYTREFVRDADGRTVQVVKPPADATVTHKTPDGKPYGFVRGRLSVIAKHDWDYVVRNLEGAPATTSVRDFTERVLNAEFLDLGPAFQVIRSGDRTYFWNLSDEPAYITLDATAPITVVNVEKEKTEENRRNTVLMILAPNAGETNYVECVGRLYITGTAPANLKFVAARYAALRERAAAVKVTLPEAPAEDWKAIQALLDEWEPKVTDTERTMWIRPAPRKLVIDGRLDDWDGVEEHPFTQWKNRDFVEDIAPLPDTGVRFAYSDEGLYVGLRVADEHVVNNHRGARLWNGDSFELFLETTLEPGRSDRAFDSDTFHLVFAPTSADGKPAQALMGHPTLPAGEPLDGVVWEVGRDDAGWTLEILLPPAALFGYAPKAGDVLGFSYVLGASSGGDRDRQYPWQKSVGMSEDRLAFGRARLLD